MLGFTIFNHCKAYSDSSLVGNMLVGAFAGCTTTVAFYPLGLARTRLGVDVGKTGADRQFNNSLDCLAKILKSDGPAGLYRGLGMSLLLTTVNKATYFGFFETGKKHLEHLEDQPHHLALLWLFASGTTALGYLTCYPLDTVRRRMMMQSGRKDVLYPGYAG